jgi:hypothetical protein
MTSAVLILGFLFGLLPRIKDSVLFSKFSQNSSVTQNIYVISAKQIIRLFLANYLKFGTLSIQIFAFLCKFS